jgi:hypothetical protein
LRTANSWQLRENAPGVAELSVYLTDVRDLPEGDLVIDPSMYWSMQANTDTMLQYNSSNLHGSDSYVSMSDDDHLLLGFWLYGLAETSTILSASVQLSIRENSLAQPAQAIIYPVTHWWAEQGANWYNYTTNQAWGSNGGDFNYQKYYSRSFTIPTSSYQKVECDVTQPFKKQFIDDPDYVQDRGFLLKMKNQVSGTVQFYMLDDATVSNRPLLAVRYGFAQFGADAGNIAAGYGTRMDNMSTDNLKIIRFFDDRIYDPYGSEFQNFATAASNRGMNVIYVIVAKDYYYNGSDYDMSRKADYADKLDTVFSRAGVQALINNGTIIGVELGNEEAVSTWDNFQTGYWFGTYTGGQRYAEFYLEAYNQLKNDTLSDALFRKLDILASASNPESHGIAFNSSAGYGSSGEFFEGFIDKVITLGGRDKLPNVVAVHQYTKDDYTYSPEFREYRVEYGDKRTEWFDRIEQIFGICDAEGFIPNFAQTEYGYSPTSGFDHAPGNTSAEAQAVYYLRHALTTSTCKIPDGSSWLRGIGWKYDFYFHHPKDYWAQGSQDYGFFDNSDNSRPIRNIAREIHNLSGDLKLGAAGSTIWVPAQREKPTPETNYEGRVWCGWKTESGLRWGAIWRYQHSSTYFTAPSPSSRNFIAEEDLEGFTVVVYKFVFNGSTATLTYQTTFTVPQDAYVNGKTTISIPNVTENPLIFKIYN